MSFKGTRPFAAPLGKGGGASTVRLRGRNSNKTNQTVEQAALAEARAAAKRKRKADKRLAQLAYRAASMVVTPETSPQVSSSLAESAPETPALEFQPDE